MLVWFIWNVSYFSAQRSWYKCHTSDKVNRYYKRTHISLEEQDELFLYILRGQLIRKIKDILHWTIWSEVSNKTGTIAFVLLWLGFINSETPYFAQNTPDSHFLSSSFLKIFSEYTIRRQHSEDVLICSQSALMMSWKRD